MAANLGSLFLLEIGDNATPTVYSRLGGLRSTGINFNAEFHDVTTKDEVPVRTLLGGGIKSYSISGAGVFVDDAATNSAIGIAHTGAPWKFRVTCPNGDTYAGMWAVKTYKRDGAHDGTEAYDLTLESAGAITFTAGA
jgi:TP901-1 family phage major tail protein